HVQWLLAGGVWISVRRGFYTHRDHWEALDERRGRRLLVVRAVHRGLLRPHVITQTSGALVHDLPFLHPRDRLVHITKYGAPRARVRNGVKHHQSRYRHDDVRQIDGLPVLGLARTALDIAREHGFAAGVCAIDAARQRGVTLAELWAAREAMWHWPRVTVVDQAISFSDPGAESIGESLSRILVDELGLGPIETQFELRDPTGWARCDLRIGRHVFEFDGLVKLRPAQRGGVALRSPEEVVAAEKRRQDWVCGFHLGMSRITWPELWGGQRELTKHRLRREYAATAARFGTSIADLAPYIVARQAS
ncbi:MAG: hypothetical protein ACJ8DJ_20455, partial [Gemmatimonadales bacterium]